ncbi:MAG: phosphoethanolamine--lipid A transferase [Rhodobacterales bacterium]|nr:MAG: phosphoethanolamine--lipid A transferase [Rhodobacterales bacterium]
MSADVTSRPAGERFALSPFALNALVATYLLIACNKTFWGHLLRIFDGRILAATGFVLVIWALILLLIALLAVRRLQKPVLIGLLIIAAVSSYYVDVLGVVVDREMIQNAMTTTFAESKHLITLRFVSHVVLYGVLPGAVVLWVPVRRSGIGRAAAGWALVTVGATAMVVGILFANFKGYSAVLRERKELLASAQPLAPVAAAARYARMMLKSSTIVVATTGADAKPGPLLSKSGPPVLMVIVAGETARAANWSLGGYGRETNPMLAARDVLYFSNVSSCGTATAVSLPCMFSPLTQAEYSFNGGLSNENLLDVLGRAGFKVEWWDNNTGDKAVAARFSPVFMTEKDSLEHCQKGNECNDGVFLKRLTELSQNMTQNTVVVLHQIGSHGPSYWLRYPDEREVFTPACKTPDLAACSSEEIVNAYDNTILYTDQTLSETIDMLDAQGRVIPALYYVSDHGESLGEGGLYLHGAPAFMAPTEQTHVPMVLWMSARFRERFALDQACLAKETGNAVSHDNMFSTVLGLVDVSTTARNPALDLTAPCRPGA